MKQYRVSLDDRAGKKLYKCPGCNQKSLVLYITETDEECEGDFGRCNHEISCGYNERPSDAFLDFLGDESTPYNPLKHVAEERIYIPDEILERTLKSPMGSSFVKSLLKLFPAKEVEAVLGLYYVGTQSMVWDGFGDAVTFPLIDEHYRVHGIQIKRFEEIGKTIYGSENWVHFLPWHSKQDWCEPYKKQKLKTNTMFGTHLLSEHKDNDVVVFESPKNSLYYALHNGYDYKNGDSITLSVLSASTLNAERCSALRDRNVMLVPDTSTDGKLFRDWSVRAELIELELGGYTNIQVSTFLEEIATNEQKARGYDYADYVRDLFMC